MMTSTWIKTDIESQFGDCDSLVDIIRRIEDLYAEQGQVVCEVRVNGMLLSEEDEQKFSQSRRADVNEISIVTNAPRDLIIAAMQSCLELAPSLQEACIQTAEALRGGETAGSLKSFREVTENSHWLVETLSHIYNASRGTGKPIEKDSDWKDAERKLTKTVREVLEAYEKEDKVLVADLLEYEMSAVMGLWSEVLQQEYSSRA